MSIHAELLDFLRSHVPAQKTLSARLGGDGRVCCYYICPFSTLRKIVEEGIRCRNSLPGCVDLSSPDVQSRRKTVWLGRSDAAGRLQRLRDVPIHSCVNLFWNPINRTFDAFQRNGLLRAAEKNEVEHSVICVLELDAERLLNESACYWTTTKGNAASNAFASFDMSYLRQFPWANTYADGPYTQEHPWQPRAAELIVFLGDPRQQHTNPIPRSCFTRVLLPKDFQLSEQQQECLSKTGLRCQQVDIYKKVLDLLRAEQKFVKYLEEYSKSDVGLLKRLKVAFRCLVHFESQNYSGTKAKVVGTTTLKMFWAAFLATYPFELNESSIHEVISAASTNCTNRNSYANGRLQAILGDVKVLEVKGSKKPDSPEGCRSEKLQLNYIPDELKAAACKKLPWVAYQLAGMTRCSPYGDQSCCRLLRDVVNGLNAGLKHNVFENSDQKTFAEHLHSTLSELLPNDSTQAQAEETSNQDADEDYHFFGREVESETGASEQFLESPHGYDCYEYPSWDDHDLDWESFDWDDD